MANGTDESCLNPATRARGEPDAWEHARPVRRCWGNGAIETTPPRPGPIPTNIDLPTVEVNQFHREHATVELAIRDLKEGAGMQHCPSGRFFANAAWLGCAVLAHNLTRWTARLGHVHPDDQLTVASTMRARLLALPGRVVNRSRLWILRLPDRWPWADTFHTAINRIRSLPLLT